MTAERMAVAFGRVLRGAGLRVPLDSVVTFVQCLDAVGITDRNRVYWAAHTAMVRRPEDREAFNVAFAVFWDRISAGEDPHHIAEETVSLAADSDDAEGDDSTERSDDSVSLRFSAVETLSKKDFATYSDSELAEAQRLMQRLRFVGSPRRSLRLRHSRSRRAQVDVRRTVRSSFAHLGEPVRRQWRAPSERMRRLVVLLDVSGSMEPYARAFLRFMHAAMVGRQRVEAFTLGTRLTRITRELSHRDPDKALARTSQQVADWSGGTRIGECLRMFNDRWGVRGLARGAIVVVLSDGWDRGNPDVLGEQMQRLSRVAHRVVWVNPLKVTPGYAPLARGMAAALPHVDAFVEGHSLEALEHLAAVIHDEGGRVAGALHA
ncbi:MAG: vWA domain-containing protein [Ilumatobacteraceae bacterium]